jgi:hypothetical protein
MGVGKDYIANKIILVAKENHIPILTLALADHFKFEACAKDKLPYESVFHHKTPESRQILQKRGTEEGRNVFGEDIWIQTLLVCMRTHYERSLINTFIILDCRFINEIESFRKYGAKVLRIEAPIRNEKKLREESRGDELTYQKIKSHISECELDTYHNFDYVYNNDVDGVSNTLESIIVKLL